MNKCLPTANITACDIHEKAVDFVSSVADCKTLLSCSDPAQFKPEHKFRVIFALSFFSHMPIQIWGRWIKSLFDSVADGGVLVFTAQGRKSLQYFPTAKINEGGYWFLADSEQKDLNTSEYGQMIIMEDRAGREIFSVLHKQPEIYQEGFWWSHQDLYVIRKD